MQGVFARIAEEWDDFRVELGELAGSGDLITMFPRYEARHKRTRKALDVQCARAWWLTHRPTRSRPSASRARTPSGA